MSAIPSLELRIPPPIVALFFALCMWLVSLLAPPLGIPFAWRLGIGLAIGATGLAIDIAAMITFRRAGTTVNPTRPAAASSLVCSGVYRFTRNPMYLGMLLDLLGWAAFLASPLALLLVPVFGAYISRFQIQPEERALSELFGGEYAAYQRRVRRWL